MDIPATRPLRALVWKGTETKQKRLNLTIPPRKPIRSPIVAELQTERFFEVRTTIQGNVVVIQLKLGAQVETFVDGKLETGP